MNSKRTEFFQTLGPGILLALSATGTSHLVQSTRAGAYFGFGLLAFVILANVFKYPFIEYGSRYAAATGHSILEGYLKKGKWVLLLYLVVNLATMFTVNGAVTFVTAGLLGNLLEIDTAVNHIAAFVFTLCFLMLVLGRYRLLDSLLKVVGVILVLTTLAAVLMASMHYNPRLTTDHTPPSIWEHSSVFFIIALMGWMPTAIELSPWNSLWTLERIKQTGFKPSLKQTLLDFNLGYWSSAVLAVAFMALGAFIIYGQSIVLHDSAIGFSGQLVSIYTQTLGSWSYWLIAVAAFCTMFSTSITVLDGFSRSTEEALYLLFPQKLKRSHLNFSIIMLAVASGGYLLISRFVHSLSALVDLATTVSFLAAPIMASINYMVVMHTDFPKVARPKTWMQLLSWLGLLFLTIFSLVYLYLIVL